jgi:hypothetical protein
LPVTVWPEGNVTVTVAGESTGPARRGLGYSAIEILLPFFGVARLEIFLLNAAAPAWLRIGPCLCFVKECKNGGQIRIRKIERRHSFIQASSPDDRANFASADVFFNEFGTRQIRPGFAAGSVASVAEGTLRREEGLTSLHLW